MNNLYRSNLVKKLYLPNLKIMILTFSKTQFRNRIQNGTKVHTIRDDKHNRWKPNMKVHFWLGNPRNTRSKTKPYQFGVGEVSRVETIQMDFMIPEDWQNDIVYIGDDIILKSEHELNALSKNDGFDNWEQMKLWFDNPDKQYFGKIIFWKNFELTANNDGSTVF